VNDMAFFILVTLTFIFAFYEWAKQEIRIREKERNAKDNNDPDSAILAIDRFWHDERGKKEYYSLPWEQSDILQREHIKLWSYAQKWKDTGIKPEYLQEIDFNAMMDGNYIIKGYNDSEALKRRQEHFEKLAQKEEEKRQENIKIWGKRIH